jgi:hypothetical protein
VFGCVRVHVRACVRMSEHAFVYVCVCVCVCASLSVQMCRERETGGSLTPEPDHPCWDLVSLTCGTHVLEPLWNYCQVNHLSFMQGTVLDQAIQE